MACAARCRLLALVVGISTLAASLGAAGKAHAQSAEERQRITDRQKGESTAKKIARFPIRLALFPLWLVDRGLEHGMLAVDEKNLIPRTQNYYQALVDKGLYVKIGGAGDGAGFGGGIAWKMADGPVSPTLATSGSLKDYQDHSFTLDFSSAFDDRLDLATAIRYRKRPEEDFFGVGPTTREADRTTYHLEQTDVSLSIGKALSKPIRIDARIEYAKSNVFEGKDERFPSTEELFSESATPGLSEGAEIVSGDLSLLFDLRDHAGDPTSGGLAQISAGLSEDVEGENDLGHWRYAGELQGYLPLLGRGNRFGPRSVLAVRVRGEVSEDLDEGTIPFYLMPWLGGSSTLRGFREFRFRDRGMFVANVEYRWRIQSLLQAVLFLDEGQVFSTVDDFDVDRFESSWGGGIRGVLRHNTVFRFEIGRSDEGTRAFFKFAQMFQVI